MASDSLNQVGKYIKRANSNASLALKRNFHKLPKKDRARDTVSNVAPFRMEIYQEGRRPITININFNKPPPSDCAVDCIATTCEQFTLAYGGHSLTMINPYEAGTVRVYTDGEILPAAQWYEENPGAGQVYVQVPNSTALIAVCYTYIIC
jgi:hypothetical protein